MKVSEQLREQLENLGEEWKIEEDLPYIILVYEDAYEFLKVTLEINDFGNVISACYEYGDLSEEIITPSSCHECSEYCDFYDHSTGECAVTLEEIEKEVAEWVDVPRLCSSYFEIERTITEIRCYIDIPHEHLYKGYLINLKVADNVTAFEILNVLDHIVDIYETYVKEVKKRYDNKKVS